MFTKREKDVLAHLLTGKSNREIAKELCISIHTVKAHIEHIYSKTKSHSRIELLLKELN